MGASAIVDKLTQAGVIDGSQDESLRLSSEFVDGYEATLQAVRDSGPDEVIERRLGDDATVPRESMETLREHSGLLAEYITLVEFESALSYEQILRILAVIDHFSEDPPRSGGAPDGFLPIVGARLVKMVGLFQHGIIYVWRDECPPCDRMRARLNEALSRDPSGLGLFSVFGPGSAEILYEEFNVVGAPTILFTVDGTVDARLQGDHPGKVVRNEIKILRGQ